MQWFSRKPYIALLASMTVIAAIPLLSSMALYFGAARIVNNQVEQLVRSAHLQYQQKVDQVLSDLNRIAIRASANQRITSILKSGQELTTADRLNIYEVRKDLGEYIRSGPESISDIYIYSNVSGYAVTSLAMYDFDLLYNRYYARIGIARDTIEQMHSEYNMGRLISLGRQNEQLIYYRSLPTYSRFTVPEVQMVVFLNKNYFESGTKHTEVFTSHFFILATDSATLLAGDLELELSPPDLAALRTTASGSVMDINGDEMIFYATRSKAGDYLVCSLVSREYIAAQTRAFTRLSSIILSVCFLLAISAVLLLSRQNYIPINRLQRYIRENYGPGEDEKESSGIYAIQETVQELITQKNLSERQLETYNQAMGISYLKGLLQGDPQSYGIDQDSPSTYVSWTDEKPFSVVCFYILPSLDPQADAADFTEATLEEGKKKIELAAKKVLQESFSWEIAEINYIVVLVMGSKDVNCDINCHSAKIEQMITVLDEKHDLSVQAAISKLHTGTDSLETAYREAALALEQCFSHDDTIMARFDVCEFKAGFYLRDWIHIDKLLQFTNMVASGRFKDALEYLNDLFPAAYIEGILPESEISALQLSSLKYQFLHVYDNLNERCPFLSETRNETIKSILYSRDHKELKGIMLELLSLASEQLPLEGPLSAKIIGEVTEYIEMNYADNQLSAASIADHFGVTPNTLSKYFSRRTEKGLLQYIHMTRISKAHELLRTEPEMSVPEIAERVGYGNTLTFTRAFKTFSQGLTPGKYRKRQNSGNGKDKV